MTNRSLRKYKRQSEYAQKQVKMKTTQNLQDSVKAVLRGRFIAIQAYLKKQEENQINNLSLVTRKRRNEEPQG